MARKLRRGARISDISAADYNRLLDLQKQSLAGKPGQSTNKQPFTKVLGRNDCGYDLQPGYPVRLDTFYPEESAFSGFRRGWFSLKPLFLPESPLANWLRPAIVLDGCPQGEMVNVAIDGVVEAKVGSGNGNFVCPITESSSSHRGTLQRSTVGFARSIAVLSSDLQLIQFGPSRWEAFYKLTQVVSGLRGTIYHSGTLTLQTNVPIADTHAIATWQAVDDVGWVELWDGQWMIKFPICRDV
jgi:hypothetical protein